MFKKTLILSCLMLSMIIVACGEKANVVVNADYGKDKNIKFIDFYATWCGPCIKLKPTVKELSSTYKHVEFEMVDVDQKVEMAQEFKVSSIPCLVLLEDGKEVGRLTGYKTKSELVKFIERQ